MAVQNIREGVSPLQLRYSGGAPTGIQIAERGARMVVNLPAPVVGTWRLFDRNARLGEVITPFQLAGAGTGTVVLVGTLSLGSGAIPFAGNVSGSVVLTGTLDVRSNFAGAITGAAVLTGTLRLVLPFAGHVAGGSVIIGALTIQSNFAGDVAGAAVLTGTCIFPGLITEPWDVTFTVDVRPAVEGVLTITPPTKNSLNLRSPLIFRVRSTTPRT